MIFDSSRTFLSVNSPTISSRLSPIDVDPSSRPIIWSKYLLAQDMVPSISRIQRGIGRFSRDFFVKLLKLKEAL